MSYELHFMSYELPPHFMSYELNFTSYELHFMSCISDRRCKLQVERCELQMGGPGCGLQMGEGVTRCRLQDADAGCL